jgi:WD40 repeat protein
VLSAENAAQIHQLARLGKGGITSLAYSPDGRYLVAGTSIGLAIFDTHNWSETLIELENSVIDVEFSSKGDVFGVGLADGTIQIRSVPEWSVTQTLVYGTVEALVVQKSFWGGRYQGLEYWQNRGATARVMVFSPDGSLLATAGWWGNPLKIWLVANGTLQKTIDPDGYVDDIAFSPDGKLMAISSWGLALWQTADWKKIFQFSDYKVYSNSPSESFESIVFSTDGNSLIGWSGQMMVFWRLSDGKVTRSYEIPGMLQISDFSSDGIIFAIATDNFDWNVFEVWDVASRKRHRLDVNHPDLVSDIAIAPDGDTLAVSFQDGRIEVWNISENALIQAMDGFPEGIDTIELLPDGLSFIALTMFFKHPILQTWNTADGSVINSIDLNAFKADYDSQIAFSPDGSKIAITDGNLQLWDFVSRKLLKTFRGEGGYPSVDDVIFTPDGSQVIYSTYGRVKVAKTSGEIIHTFKRASDPLCSFSDGQMIMTAGNGVQYWDILEGKLVKQIPLGSYHPWVYLAPGCDVFAMISWDGYFKVLQNTAEKLGQPVNVFDLRANGTYLVSPIAFSPNRELVAAQEAIGKIRIFNLQTGKTVAVLTGHMDRITSLNFTLDGKLLISSSSDGTIRLWGITPE